MKALRERYTTISLLGKCKNMIENLLLCVWAVQVPVSCASLYCNFSVKLENVTVCCTGIHILINTALIFKSCFFFFLSKSYCFMQIHKLDENFHILRKSLVISRGVFIYFFFNLVSKGLSSPDKMISRCHLHV